MRRLVWLVVIVLVAGGLFYYFHYRSAEDAKNRGKNGATAPVGVATVTRGNIDVYLNGLGNVTPRSTVTVHSRIDGQLMRLDFHEGQMVKKDQLLAELDARPYQATLEQAQGQMTRDQALLKEAKIDLQRYEILYKQDSIAKQQLDTQASLVKQYEGAVENDKGLIDSSKINIIYSNITSPVTGRVGLRQVDPGNIVHASDSNGIVVVTELQPITAIFTVPEDNIPAVMQQTQSTMHLPAEAWDRDNKNKLASGVLTAIDNEVDPATGTVKFRAEFANKDNALFPSQFVNIRLKLDTKQNIVLMPTAAVQRGTQGTFVYLIKDAADVKEPDAGKSDKEGKDKKSGKDAGDAKEGKAAVVQVVTLGTTEGENVEVQKGLNAGDIVVVDGSDNLRDGMRVKVAEKNEKGPATPPSAADTDDSAAQPQPATNANANDTDGQKGKKHRKHKKQSGDADSAPAGQ